MASCGKEDAVDEIEDAIECKEQRLLSDEEPRSFSSRQTMKP